jgi:DNA-binding NarL/FixJ family response regulator
MERGSIRVVIADDHALIVEGLKLVLGRHNIEIVAVASTGRKAVEEVLAHKPDVLLLDIRMPDVDGLQALASIKAASPKTSVIVLTSYANPEYMARALSLGASGFLSKSVEPDNIPRAVQAVASGDSIVDQDLLRSAMHALSEITRPTAASREGDAPDLTPQEVRILTLVAEGLDNNAIAELLSISRNTVKSHVHSVLAKLGVSDRTQAAMWAIRHGLVA